jgi:periplasmic protein TonB
MFEDSTFESTGKIRTRSRRWMMAAFVFNGAILVALVLIPLIYPEALPPQLLSILIEAPRLPAPQPEPRKPVAARSREVSEIDDGHLLAPPKIPTSIRNFAAAEPPLNDDSAGVFALGEVAAPDASIFRRNTQPSVIHPATDPIRVSSTYAEGMLLKKTMPTYPAIAKATRTEGTVVLQARISRSGTIENLHVVSGHPMLQMAALDAVKEWRYRPYLLNGQPIEVETTINVIFKLAQ